MPVRVCFVCLGNICRSPTAEGMFRHVVQRAGLTDAIAIDSAGTAAVHAGEPPDRRATRAAKERGITLVGRARRFEADDFDTFDYVLAMDRANFRDLSARARSDTDRAKLHRFRDFDPETHGPADVPDPYYGGDAGFEEVLDICERGCEGLLAHLREQGQA